MLRERSITTTTSTDDAIKKEKTKRIMLFNKLYNCHILRWRNSITQRKKKKRKEKNERKKEKKKKKKETYHNPLWWRGMGKLELF